MKFTQTSALLAALLLPFANAVPFQEARTVNDSTLVQTPGGLRPISNVHAVPEGGSVQLVGSEIHLLDATGAVLHVAPNDQSKIRSNADSPTTNTTDPAESGWIAYAYWLNTGTAAINSFTTSWAVPPVPTANHGQLLYLFNSIEPASYDAILQPVLQFGVSPAGGGSYWAVASWYVTGSQAYYSSLIQVTTGDVLTGVITLTSSSGSLYNYVSSFTGISGTSLTLTNSPVLVWATETLETYGVTTGADYPSGSTSFFDINLSVTSGSPGTTWSTVNDAADDIYVSVIQDGYEDAEILISYPQLV